MRARVQDHRKSSGTDCRRLRHGHCRNAVEGRVSCDTIAPMRSAMSLIDSVSLTRQRTDGFLGMQDSKQRAAFTKWLCRELTQACKKPPPPLPAGRKKGPPFKAADSQDLELNRMMANMKVPMTAQCTLPIWTLHQAAKWTMPRILIHILTMVAAQAGLRHEGPAVQP